jgi:ribosome-associated protein
LDFAEPTMPTPPDSAADTPSGTTREPAQGPLGAPVLAAGAGALIYPGDLTESFIRASGPGGQNVNKVASAVQLRLDAANAPGLSERIRARLIALAGARATKEGAIVIEASRFRTQERNRSDARERLEALLAKAAEPPPKPRRPTRPTKGAVERRLRAKVGRGTVKRMRGRVGNEE